MEHPTTAATETTGGLAISSDARLPRIWQRFLGRWLRRVDVGRLTLVLPDGNTVYCEGGTAGPHGIMRIHSRRIVGRALLAGDIGLAESYLAGEWDSPDLTALIEFAAVNQTRLDTALETSWMYAPINRLRHVLRCNTRRGSRRNIAAHYDLGEDFYGEWLDETMTYSSALFGGKADEQQDLAQAQRRKYRRIARSLGLKPGDRVLEIGCGWGAFAEIAAREFGCGVVGITVSKDQAAYASNRVAAAGLGGKVDIRFCDYRDVDGVFDRIVSIEMFEAVGENNWPIFFDVIKRRLRPGGLAAVQTIVIAADKFESYRRNPDFIQRYIFPGGMLPSVNAFEKAANAAGLALDDRYFFGASYAESLKRWNASFQERWPAISAMGFDERFRRIWTYYLCYCEAGFRANAIDVGQFLISRP